MPPAAATATPLTKEDLLAILGKKDRAPRKKREMTEEAETKMRTRLAEMREKSLDVRRKNKELKEKGALPPQESQYDIFEKKYNSQLDRVQESVTQIHSHISEMRREKAEKREAMEKKEAAEKKAKETAQAPALQAPKSAQQVSPPTSTGVQWQSKRTVPDYKAMFSR